MLCNSTSSAHCKLQPHLGRYTETKEDHSIGSNNRGGEEADRKPQTGGEGAGGGTVCEANKAVKLKLLHAKGENKAVCTYACRDVCVLLTGECVHR